jgi:hypothetical protein
MTVAFSCTLLFLVGCSKRADSDNDNDDPNLKRVTLHVKDMAERLELT